MNIYLRQTMTFSGSIFPTPHLLVKDRTTPTAPHEPRRLKTFSIYAPKRPRVLAEDGIKPRPRRVRIVSVPQEPPLPVKDSIEPESSRLNPVLISAPKTPRLWVEEFLKTRRFLLIATSVSVGLHLMLGWVIVRLLILEGKLTTQSQTEPSPQELVQVEAVAIAPTPQPSPSPQALKTPASTPPNVTPATTETPKRDRPTDSPLSKSWRWFRPNARNQSEPPTAAQNTNPETPSTNSNAPVRTAEQLAQGTAQRRLSAAQGEPLWNDSTAVSRSSSIGTQRHVSAAKGEPLWNDSNAVSRPNSAASKGTVRRFAGAGSESWWNDSPSSSKSGDRGKSQSVSPSNPPSSSPPVSNSPQNRGVTASLGTPRLTRPERDVPDQLATPKQRSQQLSTLPLGIRLSGPVVLEAIVVIEPNGKATVFGANVLSGSIDSQKAEQLAKSIIEGWSFQPTYMAGQPVAQEYFLQLSLSPIVP